MNGPTRIGSLLALAGIASLAFAAGASAGVISDPFIRITATNGAGTSTLNVPLSAADPSGGMWAYTLPSPVTLSNGAVIANMNVFVRPQNGALANLISLNVGMVAGSTDTTFQVNSALLELVPNIFDAARATAGVSVSAGIGDTNGVRFTGAGPVGSAFYASYNGEAPGGTPFATFFQIPVGTAVPGGSASANQQSLGYPTYIPIGLANDMSSMWRFVLTANDQADLTSAYFIIPSPGTLSLLGLAGLVAARRSRK